MAHIAGMDSMARGYAAAARMLADGALDKPMAERYAGWESGIDLASGDQEYLEAVVNRYL